MTDARVPTDEQLVVAKHVANLHNGFAFWPRAEEGPPAMGDYRWTQDLILATWLMAETGRPPENGLEYKVGASGGGFDVLDFKFLQEGQWLSADAEIDLDIRLNKRGEGVEIDIPIPIYGGGMSYGSVSEQVMQSRARAARHARGAASRRLPRQ